MCASSSAAYPGSARPRRVDPGWVALLLLFLLSLPLVTPRLYAVDSVEYFSYLPSILFDGDLDFTNEYRYFQQENPQAGIEGVLDKRDPTTGLPLNVAPVGTALFWSPAYLLVHGGILLARALGASVEADGLSRPYTLAVCYASVLYAFAGLYLSYRLCRRFFSPFASALAVAVVWLATPAFFYSHANPPWSHSVSLFAVALFIFTWHNTRERPTPARFFALGLLGGLVALVREQDIVFLLIPTVEALAAWRRGAARPLPALLGRPVLLAAGTLLTFSPQLAVYRVLGGHFAPNPTVAGKFTWWSPYFFQVLGDPHYGLLVWCPVLIPALAGLFFLSRRDRLLGLALGIAFLAQVYLTGAYLTWMGPGSFGPRRFIAGTVIFSLGLAAFLSFLREKGWPAWGLVALGGLFVAWNLGLIANWILYPEERTSGLLWDRLPSRLLWEIPRQVPDFLRRLFLERGSLYRNPGGHYPPFPQSSNGPPQTIGPLEQACHHAIIGRIKGMPMRVALVHDYLNQYGGAERVLEVLHALYSDAPVYTSLYDPRAMPETFRHWDIRTSFLQRLPRRVSLARLYLAWYPYAFESFDLRGYDLIVSSSSAFAKGVIPPAGARHICYCHNPARFLWDTPSYLEGESLGRSAGWFLSGVLHRLRLWDVAVNLRVDAFIANSHTVAARIARYYRRESTVIHPPVDVSSFPIAQKEGRYFLAGGRLVPHKRLDLAVTACSRLKVPLVVFGEGRDRVRLERLAGPTVRFVGRVSETELRRLYLGCRALLFPGEEDFGIAPLEAMACGRPVIAYGAGGALETVVAGRTGLFFCPQEEEALVEALASFRDGDFDPAQLRRHAEQFDVPRFQEKIRDLVQQVWDSGRER